MSNEPENSGAWFTSPIRAIIRDPLFQKQLDGLALSHSRLEEVMAGLEYVLLDTQRLSTRFLAPKIVWP